MAASYGALEADPAAATVFVAPPVALARADSGGCAGHLHDEPDIEGLPESLKQRARHAKVAGHRCCLTETPHPEHVGDEHAPDPVVLSRRAAARRLKTAAALCFVFMVGEFVGGYFANSLAIMTDAAHLLSDLSGFLISLFAIFLAGLPPTKRHSFGYARAEILGALVSVLLIWGITGVLVYEAYRRVREPQDVDGKIMFGVAAGGLAINLLMGYVLIRSGHGHSHGLGGGHGGSCSGGGGGGGAADNEGHPLLSPSVDREDRDREQHGHGHGHGGGENSGHGHGHGHGHGKGGQAAESGHEDGKDNINVRAAFVHVVGDTVQSVGVMIAGGLIWYEPKYRLADPICTFVFSVLVLLTTVRILKQIVDVLMETVPEGMVYDDILADVQADKDVLGVHDLHVWSLSVGKTALSVHVTSKAGSADVLCRLTTMLTLRHGITHSTIQVEPEELRIICAPPCAC